MFTNNGIARRIGFSNFLKPAIFRGPRMCWRLGCLVGGLACLSALGCNQPQTQFGMVNYRVDHAPQRFHQTFDECVYSLDAGGHLDVIARRTTAKPIEGVGRITQIVHLRTLFHAGGGTCPADESAPNGLVIYAILTDAGGVCYEGGGSIYTRSRRMTDVLRGELDSAKLHPVRQVGSRPDLFDRAELTGRFSAHEDRRTVIRILNELERVFGPRPQYRPPPPDRDVL